LALLSHLAVIIFDAIIWHYIYFDFIEEGERRKEKGEKKKKRREKRKVEGKREIRFV
jgi:hypothetical protein